MAQASDNAKQAYQLVNDQTDEINKLIKEFINIKAEINTYKRDRDYWELQFSTLSMNVWAMQTKLSELQKKETCYKTITSQSTKATDFKEKELRTLAARRTNEFSEQGKTFKHKNKYYANNFLNAQAEYSTTNLTRETGQYRDEYKKELRDLLILKKHLETLETKCFLNCMDSVAAVEKKFKINILLDTISENNNNYFEENKLLQNTLKAVVNETKQKKAEFLHN